MEEEVGGMVVIATHIDTKLAETVGVEHAPVPEIGTIGWRSITLYQEEAREESKNWPKMETQWHYCQPVDIIITSRKVNSKETNNNSKYSSKWYHLVSGKMSWEEMVATT